MKQELNEIRTTSLAHHTKMMEELRKSREGFRDSRRKKEDKKEDDDGVENQVKKILRGKKEENNGEEERGELD